MSPLCPKSPNRARSGRALLAALLVCSFAPLRAQAVVPGMSAGIDPRVELLGVVQYLAGLCPADQRPRLKLLDLETRFGRFRAHPVVKTYLYVAKKHGGMEGLGMALAYLGDLPDLNWKRDPDLARQFVDQVGGRARFEEFLVDLRAFSRESDFPGFFQRHRSLFASYDREALRELAGHDYGSLVGDYLGKGEVFHLTFITSVLYNPGWCCYIIPYPDLGPKRKAAGPYEVITILRTIHRDSRIDFRLDEASAHGILNEAIHLFVDKAFVDYKEEVNRYQGLYRPLAGKCLSSWSGCLAHMMVMAIANRLNLIAFGRENHFSEGPEGDIERAISQRFAEYEGNRTRYPTLESFYPRIFDLLGELNHARSNQQAYGNR